MAQTLWADAENLAEAALRSSRHYPALAASLAEQWPELARWAPLAFQHSVSKSPTLYERYVTARLLRGLMSGDVLLLEVDVGCEPFQNHLDADQNAALSALPDPFSATFDTQCRIGPMDTDGIVSWVKPVAFNAAGESVMVRPGSVPLEVGTMNVGKMEYAVASGQGPGLARWPYGYPYITIMVPRRMAVD